MLLSLAHGPLIESDLVGCKSCVHVEFLLEFCAKSLLETFSTLHHYLNFARNPKVDELFTIYFFSNFPVG